MQIQSHLASTIAMAFDECIENPAPYEYVKNSVARTARWLRRCRAEMDRLNSLPETINRHRMLFGINRGGTYEDLRIAHMQGDCGDSLRGVRHRRIGCRRGDRGNVPHHRRGGTVYACR